ncbi:glycoside hydrolase family 18 protein [Butyriboletus roseoflavus]|nr:glycoside hydrolase family 18 protein [Butyriboletus roseoflavus]
MVSIRSGVTASLAVLSVLGLAQTVPLADKLRRLSPSARHLLKRSTPAAPHFVAYNDLWLNPFPSVSDLQGFNVFALAFLMSAGAVDEAQNWQSLTDSDRTTYVQEYNAAGISLIVSAFGSTDTPTSSGVDPVTVANTMAVWVTQYGVNGIDVDYEDLTAFNGGSAESWLISFIQQLRTQLPEGEYILTSAPLAPWFSPTIWSGGGFLYIDQTVGPMIDWYNIQFYNQGDSEYTTCSGLLYASSSSWPQTSLFEIAANGVALDKLVIGKPGIASDATNGYMDPSTLASCVSEAASAGWNAGVMVWQAIPFTFMPPKRIKTDIFVRQYPDVSSSWITTVRGSTWPVTSTSH